MKELQNLNSILEKGISEQINRFKALTDSLPGYVAFVNANSLKYEFVNKAFEDSFKIPVDKIVGTHIREVIGEKNYQFALPYIKVVLSGNPVSYENTFNLANGKRWIKVNYVPFFNEDKNVSSIVVLSYDITDTKQAELNLKESESKLKTLNQDKDKFFSIISHDLKNPISTIIGFLKLIQSSYNEINSDEVKTELDLIHQLASEAYSLLDNLLIWSKSQSGNLPFHPQKIKLKLLLSEIFSYFKGNSKAKNIQLTHTIDEDFYLYADYNMLSTILRNLLSNAIKFTEINGKILVIAEKTDTYTQITVSDNGIGFPEDKLKDIWKFPYTISTKGTAEESGHGFGLSLCKDFIDKHGGNIYINNNIDKKGTSINFTVPNTYPELEIIN